MDLVIKAGSKLVRLGGTVFRREDFRRVEVSPRKSLFDVIVYLDENQYAYVATFKQEVSAVEVVARIYEVLSIP